MFIMGRAHYSQLNLSEQTVQILIIFASCGISSMSSLFAKAMVYVLAVFKGFRHVVRSVPQVYRPCLKLACTIASGS